MSTVALPDEPAAHPAPEEPKREMFYRHTRIVRISHWINALCFLLLLMSGAQIFNAHPRLYWGQAGANSDTPWLKISPELAKDNVYRGQLQIGGAKFNTDGVLGATWDHGKPTYVAFPGWITIPSWHDLGMGRHWHFFFAWALVINGATYLVFGFLNRHLQRDITPKLAELKPRHLLQDIWDHLRLKHPTGEAAKSYNTLQKIAYFSVIFLLFPVMILTGLTMSPGFNAVVPVLLDLFGGRQSARSIHFIAANLLVLFLIVHLVQVVIAGAWNEIRSMITGRYAVPTEKHS